VVYQFGFAKGFFVNENEAIKYIQELEKAND